jgi:hypothetical protein
MVGNNSNGVAPTALRMCCPRSSFAGRTPNANAPTIGRFTGSAAFSSLSRASGANVASVSISHNQSGLSGWARNSRTMSHRAPARCAPDVSCANSPTTRRDFVASASNAIVYEERHCGVTVDCA